mgnify:CR=1 FL=1
MAVGRGGGGVIRIARAMLWTGAGVVLGVLTVVAVMSW